MGACQGWIDDAKRGRARVTASGRLAIPKPEGGLELAKKCPHCGKAFFDSMGSLTEAGREHRAAAKQAGEAGT